MFFSPVKIRLYGPIPFGRFSPRVSSERLVSRISRPSPTSSRVTSRGKISPNTTTPFQPQNAFRGFQFQKPASKSFRKTESWRLIVKPVIFVFTVCEFSLSTVYCFVLIYQLSNIYTYILATILKIFIQIKSSRVFNYENRNFKKFTIRC